MRELAVLGALALVLGGCAQPPTDTAGLDKATTQQVLDAVRYDISTVFPVAADAGSELVREHLVGPAQRQVSELTAATVSGSTGASVTVAAAGVVRLVGDTASVLVVGSRDETVGAGGGRFREQVVLLVALHRVDRLWRMADVQVNPTSGAVRPPVPRVAPTLPDLRDDGVAVAAVLAVRLSTFDRHDVAGSYRNWLAVAGQPLAGRLRAMATAITPNTVPDTTLVADDPVVAPVEVRLNRVTALVSLNASVYTGTGAISSVLLPVRLTVERGPDRVWRAVRRDEIDATDGA